MLPLQFLIEEIKVIEYTGYDLGEFELRGYNRGDGYTLNRGTLVTVMYEHAVSPMSPPMLQRMGG